MILKNLFSTPLWKAAIPVNTNLLNAAGLVAQSQNYFDVDHFAIQELKDQIYNCIDLLAKDFGTSIEQFAVTARQNPIEPMGFDSPHNHTGAILVGVYYIQVPPNSGDILLHDPRGVNINWPDPDIKSNERPFVRITPSAGDLLLFPGYLVHSVEPNLSNETRISLAINVVDKLIK